MRNPSKMVGGVELCLELNPIPTRDAWRVQANLVCTGTPQRLIRTVAEGLLWRYGPAVECHGGRDSGCGRPAYGISPLGRGRH